jgi:hypothetical protein
MASLAYLKAQNREAMAWTTINSGPYIETLTEVFTPTVDADGSYVFSAPLQNGAVPLVYLDDLARSALWALENPQESNGLEFGVAIEHATWENVASSFTKVTGKPARWEDTNLAVWLDRVFGDKADDKIGSGYAPGDNTLLSNRQNFAAWWELYRASGNNQGILQRDYAFLDRILPTRVKSVEEWMRKTKYDGAWNPVLQHSKVRQPKP